VSALRKIEGDERRPSRQLAELLAVCLQIAADERPSFLQVARGLQCVDRLASTPAVQTAAKIEQPGALPANLNLPTPPVSLLGRERELAALAQLLSNPQCRLLTVTGPGGIGKTSLALVLASSRNHLFSDGAHFIALASLTSPRFIVPAIADMIGCTFSGPLDPRAQLLNFLRDKCMLLVLDNLEHLLAGVEVLAEILQHAAKVKLLVTSRERLNLMGEWLFDLQGLPVPSTDYLDRVEEYSAVMLFLQSGRRVGRDFVLGPAERRAVARICELVEGVPLAIELAAAWLRVLTCEEIAAEIECSLDFLSGALRDAPARQQSLRATFDHSWNLLAAEERQLLCRLAVFRGGFERLAGEQVAGASLPILSALVDKSLLQRAANGRYDLHELVRQYALEHLAENPQDKTETCDRHSEYYLSLLRDCDRDLRSANHHRSLRALVQEIDNIRTAWLRACKQNRFDLLEPALRGFGGMYELAGWLQEGVAQLEIVVEAARAACRQGEYEQRVLGEALALQGMICFRWGKFDSAQSILEESIHIVRRFGDPALLHRPLLYRGIVLHLNGELDQAQTYMEESLVCARMCGERWFEAYAVFNLGYIASLRGQYGEGYARMCDGLAIWRTIGDPRSIALGLNYRSPAAIKLGYYTETQRDLEESLVYCEQVNDRWGKGTALRCMGLAALAQGDAGAAEELFRRSLDVFEGYVVGWDIVRSLIYWGEAAGALGKQEEARRILCEALVQVQMTHAAPLAMDALAAMAALLLRDGAVAQALRIASFVLAHPATTYESKKRADQLCSEAEARLTPELVKCRGKWTARDTLETLVSEVQTGTPRMLPIRE
jgi:predicted ATPase